MKRPEPDSPESGRRSHAAAEWLVRCDRGLSPTEQDEFLEWLAADPRHGEWLAVHRATVADFTALAHWRPEHSEEPNPDLLAPPRRHRRWLVPLLLAASVAIAIGSAFWPRASSAPAASQARRLLEDGSSVELNRGTVVHHAFTPTERRVELVTGEAFFSVTKDAARPFVVHAGGIDVRAVGTAFSVRLDSGAVEVLVTEGRVGVRHEKDGPSHGAAADGATTYVGAGEKATVARAAGTPPEVSVATSIQISRHLGWQAQWLDFSSAPLAVAVAEFNHRNRVQFEIADADLAALPIIALIRSDNVEGFAQFLAAAPGVQVERRSDELIIVHRRR